MKRKYKQRAYKAFERWMKTEKPPIFVFWRDRYTHRSKRYLGTYLELTDEGQKCGMPPEVILIAGRQDPKTIILTYAHEVRHYHQSKQGLPTDENDAEEFAQRTYERYINGEPYEG